MSVGAGESGLLFECIVERPRSAPFGGRYAIIVALLLLLIALAAAWPAPDRPAQAGAPIASTAA